MEEERASACDTKQCCVSSRSQAKSRATAWKRAEVMATAATMPLAEMNVIHFRRGSYFILELVGVFCLQLGAVGGRENGCKTVFGH